MGDAGRCHVPGPGGLAEKVDEARVLQKLNRHLLPRFMLLTALCYLVRARPLLQTMTLSSARAG